MDKDRDTSGDWHPGSTPNYQGISYKEEAKMWRQRAMDLAVQVKELELAIENDRLEGLEEYD